MASVVRHVISSHRVARATRSVVERSGFVKPRRVLMAVVNPIITRSREIVIVRIGWDPSVSRRIRSVYR